MFVVLCAVVIGVAGVVVGLRYIQGNSVKVNPVVVTVVLSANSTVPLVGDVVRFSSVLSNGQVGVPVTFYSDLSSVNASLGVVNSGVGGVAVMDVLVGGVQSFSVYPVAQFP